MCGTENRWLGSVGVLLVALPLCLSSGGAITLLLSVDTEGQIRACQSCPSQAAPGGMARRATLIGEQRKSDPSLLLVDAGNALLGTESIASGGDVIVAAYNALSYDAINLSYRDFRLGKARTLKMLEGARFAVVSCNLLDDSTGQLIGKPYVVRQARNERLAIIGVTATPAALDELPHLKLQLAGIRVQPALEALSAWLPKAKGEAGRVILLFYGPATVLDAVRRKFGSDLTAILVGGIRPEALPSESRPPIVGTTEHGQRIAELRLTADGLAHVKQIDIDPSITTDPHMEELLKPYLRGTSARQPPAGQSGLDPRRRSHSSP